MNRICLKCNVISQDFNMWCQETYCPAENATEFFNNGEWFGPFEIIQPIVVLRSSITYQASRNEEQVLLKIANVGCEGKLRQESLAFLKLAKAGQHPLLPVLLPAHPQSTIQEHPYGWTVIEDRVKYYSVFQFSEGEILRNYLMKIPQPWYQHVGWITLSIIDVIYYLHRANKIHLCLNPDVIFLRFDKQGIPRPMLLDLGVGDLEQDIHAAWNDSYNLAAYTPPEVLQPGERITPAADVYGIGLIAYEMLSGHPAFEYHLKKDEAIYEAVLAGNVKPTGRIDLKDVPQVIEKAIQRNAENRYPDVLALANDLKPYFPRIPAEKKPRRINWKIVFIILAAALAISLLLLFALAVAS